MAEPLLQLNGIRKSFGAVRALRGVTFTLEAGEVHALVGENGAGKSTLIKIITGAYQADEGEIRMGSEWVPKLTPALAHRLGVAAIYQQPALFPDLSVAENIALGLEKPRAARRVNWRRRTEQARELLELVGARLDPEVEVKELSMPEQQLVEIARALGAGARILIMDEPTASLATKEVELLLKLVEALRRQGVGVIYISHRLPEVFQVADRVTVLRDGESVGTRRVRPGSPHDRESAPLTERDLIRMMVGREVAALYPPKGTSLGRPLLKLSGVGSRVAGISDISLELRAGEILGVAGLIGAGRTELAQVLFGLAPADAGQVMLEGKEVSIRSPRQAVEAGIAYVPEDRRRHGVILEMDLATNLTLAIHRTLFRGHWLRLQAERNLAGQWMRELQIKAQSWASTAGDLSGGNQQKVALGRWLAATPKILILDEPTQGVDVGAKAELHRIMRQLAQSGLAIMMISSDLPEVLGMSDRIAVMRAGRMVAMLEGPTDASAVMAAAFGGN